MELGGEVSPDSSAGVVDTATEGLSATDTALNLHAEELEQVGLFLVMWKFCFSNVTFDTLILEFVGLLFFSYYAQSMFESFDLQS